MKENAWKIQVQLTLLGQALMAFGEREVFTYLFGVVFATAVDTGVPDHCVSQKHVENVDKKQTARLMEKMSRKINTCYLLSVIQTSIAIAELAVPPLLSPLRLGLFQIR